MKQKIYIYSLVFSSLLILFQYINSKRLFEEKDIKINKYKTTLKNYKDSLNLLQNTPSEASHFNLKNNEDAISYFEKDGHNTKDLIPLIKDELYKLNEAKKQHPLVPYAASEGRKIMINTVEILNHKWIIADFSDGEYWGEVFITYEVTKDKQLRFKLAESFLYPFY